MSVESIGIALRSVLTRIDEAVQKRPSVSILLWLLSILPYLSHAFICILFTVLKIFSLNTSFL